MKTFPIFMLLVSIACRIVLASEPAALPKDVPPVLGAAIASADSERWAVQLSLPKITWEVVGEQQPKVEWPEFKVNVEEAVLTLSMGYHPATQLSDDSQNRIVDLKGRRLERNEALNRLKEKTPVLISVSGRMPDPFYLQCTKTDALIVILGIPDSPAPHLLPHALEATAGPAIIEDGRTTP
ncbi:hypothetical protein [Aureliella helgolandensis]|uniref:Uncharacterized protein n=1 Tax=Aureliella helgolandensis TaxID=2527968 RepID=A0A518GED3_9BACT|nr:hypothetical protein [Aureliella helgolandensis]QDV26959.1 hypothetical protein Q31a_53390 [Aureliella helgolandensis]